MEDPITPIDAILQRCPQQQMCLQYNITTYTNVNEFLGTIHILRKQLYSTKLNFSPKLIFFCQTKRIYFSLLHFDEIFMLKFEVFSTYIKKKKNVQKNS